jgi:CBS domain-containing protein
MTARVKDTMTRNVVAVHEQAGYKDIIAVMRRRHVSALPVLDDQDRVVGVVSENDLLLKEAYPDRPSGSPRRLLRRPDRAKAAALTAAGLMSSPAVTIAPEATVADAAQVMHGEKVKRLPVVDDAGRLAGIVSRVDVLGAYDRPDGQIRDEILGEVIEGEFCLDACAFEVEVNSGIVTIAGQADNLSAAESLLDAIWDVAGVVDIRDRLTYPGQLPHHRRPGSQ